MREELEKILNKPFQINEKSVYIWGTGNTSLLYQEGLKRLEEERVLYIEGYVDNDSSKWLGGQKFEGKPIISPNELLKRGQVCVLISSPQPKVINAIKQQLAELHIEGYHIDEVILGLHRDDVLKCYDLLEDEQSREIYVHIIQCRMQGTYPAEKYVSSNQYFALRRFRQRDPKELFIDCGAFVGDSIERYIWEKDGIFDKIVAFEPDQRSYQALEKRIGRLKEEWDLEESQITVYPYGVSDSGTYSQVERDLANHGLSSKITANSSIEGETCRVVAVDDFIKEAFTFLKADIEGYEYKMLLGAKESIIKYHPLLAVCIYHNAADLYDIPMLIKAMVPEYKMSIRHHSDLLDETVLYAWVE